MSRFPRFTRLAAAGALVLSTLVVAGIAPADAVPVPTGSVDPVGGTGTATITYSDTTKVEAYLIDSSASCDLSGSAPTTGILGTIGVLSPMPASPVTVTPATQVGPAPAHALGSGSFNFCLYDVVGSVYTPLIPATLISIFTPVSGSMAEDGKGGITVTYANDDPAVNQTLYVLLLSGVTECPADPNPLSVTGFAFQSGGGGLTTSPMTIAVGTTGVILPMTGAPAFGPVTAGSYMACLYYTDAVTSNVILQQSLATSIHTAVVPSFTG